MNEVIATWRDSLHQVLDLYERKRGSLLVFFPPPSFLFSSSCRLLLVGQFTAFPHYMQTHEASHYLKLQIPVGFLGALFDSLSFFVTLWIIRRALASVRTAEYVMYLSLDLVIRVLATLWVLFVFSFRLADQSLGRSLRASQRGAQVHQPGSFQAIQDPTGRKIEKYLFQTILGSFRSPSPVFISSAFLFRLSVKAKKRSSS